VSVKGKLAGEHLVGDDAQRVDVGCGSEGRARGLLRGHVRGGADIASAAGERALALADRTGDSEVGHHDAGPPSERGTSSTLLLLKSRWRTPCACAAARAAAIWRRSGSASSARKPPAAGDGGGEGLPVEELHDQEEQLTQLGWVSEELVDAADVGVGDGPSEQHLSTDAFLGIGNCSEEDLHRDAGAEHAVLGLVDDAHSAAGDEALQLEAPGQHGALGKHLTRGAGRCAEQGVLA
jgi:hypothetical protein